MMTAIYIEKTNKLFPIVSYTGRWFVSHDKQLYVELNTGYTNKTNRYISEDYITFIEEN